MARAYHKRVPPAHQLSPDRGNTIASSLEGAVAFRYLLATGTQLRLLLEKSMFHNRKYFVLCMTLNLGAIFFPKAAHSFGLFSRLGHVCFNARAKSPVEKWPQP